MARVNRAEQLDPAAVEIAKATATICSTLRRSDSSQLALLALIKATHRPQLAVNFSVRASRGHLIGIDFATFLRRAAIRPSTKCCVTNPPILRWPACLPDDQVDLTLYEDCQQIVAVCSRIEEAMFASFCVEKTANRIEFAEILCESFHRTSVPWVWGWNIETVVVNSNPRSRG